MSDATSQATPPAQVTTTPAEPAAPAPAATTAAPATPATPPAAAPAPVTITPIVHAKPPVLATDDSQTDPNWLANRLARERSKALTAAGFASEEEARQAAAAIKAQKEAEKATLTKLTERDEELKRVKTRAEQLESATREYAARMMAPLSEAQKKAVGDLAGDDPSAQIKAITVLTPTWAQQAKEAADAAAATAGTTTTAPATPAAPAAPVTPKTPAPDTAPGRTAPQGGDTSQPNHRQVYESLVATNPFAAAKYGAEHPEAYKSA